ncbi:MAG: hypothetical protein ACOCW2_05025, partial [Chitinivibrionales bacterium]
MKRCACTPLPVVTALVFALFQSAPAQSLRYAGELMHIPLGCRSVGMGNATAALSGRGNTGYWNPALASLDERRFGIIEGARLYEGLSNLGSAAAFTPVQNGLVMGATYTAFFSGH